MNDSDTPEVALEEPVVSTETTPKEEAKASGLDEAKVLDLIEKRATAIADQKAKEAGEQAYRRAQAKFDKDFERVQKQYREREQSLLDQLPELGLDADSVKALKGKRSQLDKIEELEQKAGRADQLDQQAQLEEQKQAYIARECKRWGVNQHDPRLDFSGPEVFDQTLAKIVREDAVKPEPKPEDKPKKTDLEPLGGGGSAPSGLDAITRKMQQLLKATPKTPQERIAIRKELDRLEAQQAKLM